MSRVCVRLVALAGLLCVCMFSRVSLHEPNSTEPAGKDISVHTYTSQYPETTVVTEGTDTQPNANTSITHGDGNITSNSSSNSANIIPTTAKSVTPTSTTAKSVTPTSTTAESTPTNSTAPSVKSTTDSKTTTASGGSGGKSAGIFILLVIIILVCVLVFILWILWKKGKKYSFDLTNGEHDTPLRSMEHAGIFEPTKGSTSNLDYIQENSLDKTNPVANGCSGETPDQTSCSEQPNVPEEDSFTSDLSLDSPVKKVEFNLDLELIGRELEVPKQATDEPTDNNDNENNNNETIPGADSADLFTEINLDDTQ